MSQFIAYLNPNSATRAQYPYLLDIQSDLLSQLRTTIVIPLSPVELAENRRLTRLNPVIEINAEKFVLITQEIAGIDRQNLGDKVSDITANRDAVIAAIDFALSGI